MEIGEDFFEEIEIELTGTCNLKCPLCTRNYSHANHQTIKNIRSLDNIKLQLSKFKNLKHINIAGTVSEPTLYPYLLELLEWIISINPNIEIDLYSNASILDPELWKNIGKLFTTYKHRMIFTICGSTQELHSKYRVGSDLQTILNNAEYFKSTNKSKSDYIQYIVFKYNEKDSFSDETKKILNTFNNIMMVGSEGIRLKNIYNQKFTNDIGPIEKREKLINKIYNIANKKNYRVCIDCKSLKQKRLYIDQFGKEYACYILAEHYKDSYFKAHYNFDKIKKFDYNCCLVCEKQTQLFIDKFNLDFIC